MQPINHGVFFVPLQLLYLAKTECAYGLVVSFLSRQGFLARGNKECVVMLFVGDVAIGDINISDATITVVDEI